MITLIVGLIALMAVYMLVAVVSAYIFYLTARVVGILGNLIFGDYTLISYEAVAWIGAFVGMAIITTIVAMLSYKLATDEGGYEVGRIELSEEEANDFIRKMKGDD